MQLFPMATNQSTSTTQPSRPQPTFWIQPSRRPQQTFWTQYPKGPQPTFLTQPPRRPRQTLSAQPFMRPQQILSTQPLREPLQSITTWPPMSLFTTSPNQQSLSTQPLRRPQPTIPAMTTCPTTIPMMISHFLPPCPPTWAAPLSSPAPSPTALTQPAQPTRPQPTKPTRHQHHPNPKQTPTHSSKTRTAQTTNPFPKGNQCASCWIH